MLKEENIKKLSLEEFNSLMDYIGDDNLKFMLQKRAVGFPKTSKYYNGSGNKGTFWRGFRANSIPASKVRKFYVDEVYNDTSKLKLAEFLNVILKLALVDPDELGRVTGLTEVEEKVRVEENPKLLEKLTDVKIIELYERLYEIELDSKCKDEIIEKEAKNDELNKALEALSKECEERINTINDNHTKALDKLNNKITTLNHKIEDLNAELNIKNEELKKRDLEIPNLVNEAISKIIKKYSSKNAYSMLKDMDILDHDSLIKATIELNKELQGLILNNRLESLKDSIVLEYVLVSLLEGGNL